MGVSVYVKKSTRARSLGFSPVICYCWKFAIPSEIHWKCLCSRKSEQSALPASSSHFSVNWHRCHSIFKSSDLARVHFFYIYLRFILCKRKEQQQKKKSGQEEGENYLTARWLKTRDCQARRITHTSEPKLKRNNQMPILEKNCYQNQCHQTKPM